METICGLSAAIQDHQSWTLSGSTARRIGSIVQRCLSFSRVEVCVFFKLQLIKRQVEGKKKKRGTTSFFGSECGRSAALPSADRSPSANEPPQHRLEGIMRKPRSNSGAAAHTDGSPKWKHKKIECTLAEASESVAMNLARILHLTRKRRRNFRMFSRPACFPSARWRLCFFRVTHLRPGEALRSRDPATWKLSVANWQRVTTRCRPSRRRSVTAGTATVFSGI